MKFVNLTNELFNSTENSIAEDIDTASIILEIFLSIIAVLLNTLSIALISVSIRKKRTYSNIIFLLINITDFISGLISIPGDVALSYSNWSWTYSTIICVFYKTFDFGNGNFSLMLLLVITIHRWLQLKCPFKEKEEMNRRRWMLILMLFVFNYGIWFGIWYIYFNKDENKDICYLKSINTYIFVYNFVVSLCSFLLIMSINLLMIRIFFIKKSKSHNKKEINAIYCILAITVNLIISWGLFIIIWHLYKLCKNCVPDNLYGYSYLLNYSFAATNPIILLVFNQNYRSVLFKKLKINGISK